MPVTRESDVQCPIGENVLLFQRMTGVERLGRPFEFHLELRSDNTELKLNDVLGQPMTVRMDTEGGNSRYFNGFTSEFSFVGMAGRQALYTATLRPWLWFLTRAQDCRIFQDKTAPDIIQEVFQAHNFSDVESMLNGEYKQLGYCVQYRETDFDFVTRLMEQEGIYYYFRHEEGKHTLVLADGLNSHELIEDFETTLYYPPDANERREKDHVSEWMMTQQAHTSTYALRDYDFTKPRAGLDVKATVDRGHDLSGFEQFDYPGLYTQIPDGEQYVETRIQEVQTDYERALAGGSVRGLFAGGLTELTNHPREDQNKEYLIESVEHELVGNLLESGSGADGGTPGYKCKFTAIDSQQRYRLPRSTQKPFVQGPQTAVVTGPEGEKIWPDEYGRVKVKFHWDRHGKGDATSSCWVRVSQNWAGKGWGGMFIPHVGHEVIVDFLEGDPDQPIITGRVYNGDNSVPQKLPDNMHKSIIRDDYGNELVFDATPGEEHIVLQSPHHKSKLSLGQSVKYTTDSSYNSWTYGNSTGGTLGSSAKLSVGANASATLGAKASLTVGASIGAWLGADFSISVGYKYSVSCNRSFSLSYGSSFSWDHASSHSFGEADKVIHNLKDIKIDSETQVAIIGGEINNSYIEMNKDHVELAFGEGAREAIKSEADFASTAAKKGALGVVAALVASAAPIGVAMTLQSGGAASDSAKDTKVTAEKAKQKTAEDEVTALESQKAEADKTNQATGPNMKNPGEARAKATTDRQAASAARTDATQKRAQANDKKTEWEAKQKEAAANAQLQAQADALKVEYDTLKGLADTAETNASTAERKAAESEAAAIKAEQFETEYPLRLAAAKADVDSQKTKVKEAESEEAQDTYWGPGLLGISGAAVVALGAYLAFNKIKGWLKDPSGLGAAAGAAMAAPVSTDRHTKQMAAIKLDKDGVEIINAKKGQHTAHMTLEDKIKGTLKLGSKERAKASIWMSGPNGEVSVKAETKFEVDSPLTNFTKGKIVHPSLTVLP